MSKLITFKKRSSTDYANVVVANMIKDELKRNVQLIGANNESVHAHSVILSMYSVYLRSLLRYSEPDKNFIVLLPIYKKAVLEKVVEFSYHGSVQVPSSIKSQVFRALDFLGVEYDKPVPVVRRPAQPIGRSNASTTDRNNNIAEVASGATQQNVRVSDVQQSEPHPSGSVEPKVSNEENNLIVNKTGTETETKNTNPVSLQKEPQESSVQQSEDEKDQQLNNVKVQQSEDEKDQQLNNAEVQQSEDEKDEQLNKAEVQKSEGENDQQLNNAEDAEDQKTADSKGQETNDSSLKNESVDEITELNTTIAPSLIFDFSKWPKFKTRVPESRRTMYSAIENEPSFDVESFPLTETDNGRWFDGDFDYDIDEDFDDEFGDSIKEINKKLDDLTKDTIEKMELQQDQLKTSK